MSSIPLPALDIRPPAPQESPVQSIGQLLQLKNAIAQQKTQQLQQTGMEQENQQRDSALKDQQALRTLAPQFVTKDESGNAKFDFNGFFQKASGSGISPQTLNAMQLQHAEAVQKMASADETTRNNEVAKNKAAYELLESVRSVKDPAQQQQAYQAGLPNLQKLGVDTSNFPAQVPTDPDTFDSFEAALGMHAQVIADAKTAAETNEANQKANLAKMEAAEKGSPLTKMENDPTMFAGDKLPASMAYLQSKIKDADPATASRAKRLLSTAQTAQQNQLAIEKSKKAADQAIQDGDPIIAGQLLHDGIVAPSQIISSRKPEFAQKAFSAAASKGDGWNAQKAEADFKVASSPAQVGFFGSAKSLTDKGGTLDQLMAAAKDIPGGKIPIFNSVADALAAASGSGPIAKYASIALGVADDYSKVMGGGEGSDTSRTQALNLIAKKLSPEGRIGSVEGIRGSVESQKNSRIGSNPVLKQMYGGSGESATPKAEAGAHVAGGKAAGLKEGQTGTGSDGKKYIVKGGVWVAQ